MVVGLGILLVHKVRIVGTHQFDTIFLSQLYQHLVGLLLQGECLTIGPGVRIGHFVTLQLQIIVVTP